MSVKKHKPLFSRRYLAALIWGVAIAIVLLNLGNQEQKIRPLNLHWHDQPAHWRLSSPAFSDVQIQAIYPIDSLYARTHRYVHRSIEKKFQLVQSDPTIQQWLAKHDAKMSLSHHAAYRAITLTLAKEPNVEDLRELMTLFLVPVEILTSHERAEVDAALLLDQTHPEKKLLSELAQWLVGSEVIPASHWTWSLMGPRLEKLQQSKDRSDLQPLTPMPSQSSTFKPLLIEKKLEGYQADYYSLFAWAIPRVLNATELAKMDVLAELLKSYVATYPQDGFDVRLQLRPLQHFGYMAFIVKHPQRQMEVDLFRLQVKQALVDPEKFQQAKQRLQNDLNSTVNNEAFVKNWLTLTMLTGFSANAVEEYAQAINSIERDEFESFIASIWRTNQLMIHLSPY